MADERDKPQRMILPKVDRKAALAYISGSNDDLGKFFAALWLNYKYVEMIDEELRNSGEASLAFGVMTTVALLAISKATTGEGTIPEDLPILSSPLFSELIRGDRTKNKFEIIQEIFDNDPELFFGLTLVAIQSNTNVSQMFEGATIILGLLNKQIDQSNLTRN